ncbi:MAG TPA: hypothetical protein DHV12_01335 [Thermotogae bacterium]|nr:hypothetical protein [Thermotogota bacterium]
MRERYRIFLSAGLLVLAVWWLHLDHLNFLGEIRFALARPWLAAAVVLLTYAMDNLEWRAGPSRMVTNVVGVAAGTFTIGWRFATLLPLLIFLRRGSYSWGDKFRIFSNYFFAYYMAGVIMDFVPVEMKLLRIFTYLAVFRIVNWLVVDLIGHGRLLEGLFTMETLFFISLVPSYYAIVNASSDWHKIFFFTLPLITLLAVRELLRAQYIARMEKLARKRVENVNTDLEKILEMMKFIRCTQEPEKVLQKIASMLATTFGFRYALVNLFDRVSNRVERVACYGIDEEDFKRLKENAPSVTETLSLMKPEYRVSNSFFIPEGAVPLSEETVFYGYYEETSEENAWHPADMFLIPINDSSGEMIGYISLDSPIGGKRPRIEEIKMIEVAAEVIGRILEDAMEYIQIFQRAQRDSLTGLLNHSAFYNHLEKAVRSGIPFSVVMIDLDNFKEINDSFGHLVGDEILRRLSTLLKEKLRESDVIARYGGDEFAVILTGVTSEKALEILERVRYAVEGSNFLGLKLSVSIGVSCYPEDGETAETLVEKADTALYRSKSKGKNRITVFKEEEEAHEGDRKDR